jgi:transposase
MLRSGARWRDCPVEYGSYTTVYNRFNRWSRQGIWLAMFEAVTGRAAIIGTAAIDGSHIKAHPLRCRWKRGAFEQAIGRSRGGRTTTLHALTDDFGRPCVLLLAPGNQHP